MQTILNSQFTNLNSQIFHKDRLYGRPAKTAASTLIDKLTLVITRVK